MNHDPLVALEMTRRRFFGASASSMSGAIGTTALASLLGNGPEGPRATGTQPVAAPHFRPRAKRVIYLHMEGGPSQIDTWDHKPQLRDRFDQDLPESVRNGQRLTGMTSGQSRFPVAPSAFRFTRYRNQQEGAWISELFPTSAPWPTNSAS